ncbi:hypothetical protein KR51_00035060 [Rubidibacter lacunae KORDI 51-2]|uniref:Uncharacterized protein n=1 Tax=Rubidibacter lacunae KORDI 51-2 TaxID=582515 RepID=U5D5S9_9CHRO|nr:hypothetical protein KR51_00035060 [Rubidibacter lacunae KORDI 51-2]
MLQKDYRTFIDIDLGAGSSQSSIENCQNCCWQHVLYLECSGTVLRQPRWELSPGWNARSPFSKCPQSDRGILTAEAKAQT